MAPAGQGSREPGAGPRPAPHPGADFRLLFHKLEEALAQIERTENISKMLEVILESLIERFEDELGLEGGRVYTRDREGFVLCCGAGTSRHAVPGLRVPLDYPPHLRVLSEGLLVMRRDEPGFDPVFERAVGVTGTFAAIAVGEGNSHVIAFSIKGRPQEDQLLFSLSAVRHVINLKLRQQKVTGILEESRLAHEVILPAEAPDFAGFDIAGRSRPAEAVSGDLFDFFHVADDLLGLAIGDSSGHGLPAALLARDVLTGLRMANAETAQLTSTIERLNQVIHRAALASKFVSLFFGELRRDGRLVYCNAGHNPPLLRHGSSFLELERGGMVLGPLATARYETDEARLEPGDTLVLYTDGVVEQEDRAGTLFGMDGLRRLLLERAAAGAAELADAILAEVDSHAGGMPAGDDRTVLVVRRP